MTVCCGHYLGDTSCVLPSRHDGDHQPADTVVVDRHLRPVNRRYVRFGKQREVLFASVSGDGTVFIGPNHADDPRGTYTRRVNRPAVRVGDRWLRRCSDLEVVDD